MSVRTDSSDGFFDWFTQVSGPMATRPGSLLVGAATRIGWRVALEKIVGDTNVSDSLTTSSGEGRKMQLLSAIDVTDEQSIFDLYDLFDRVCRCCGMAQWYMTGHSQSRRPTIQKVVLHSVSYLAFMLKKNCNTTMEEHSPPVRLSLGTSFNEQCLWSVNCWKPS